jgi:hypothetical protein
MHHPFFVLRTQLFYKGLRELCKHMTGPYVSQLGQVRAEADKSYQGRGKQIQMRTNDNDGR